MAAAVGRRLAERRALRVVAWHGVMRVQVLRARHVAAHAADDGLAAEAGDAQDALAEAVLSRAVAVLRPVLALVLAVQWAAALG